MAKSKIEHGTVAYIAIYNLSGLFDSKPIRVIYKDGKDEDCYGYWVNMGKNSIAEEVGLGLTMNDRRAVFVSTDKHEVETFIRGIQTVVSIARASLFWQEEK